MNYRRLWIFLILLCLAILIPGCSPAGVPNLSPGWQTIRPTGVVLALSIRGNTVWAGGRDGVYELDRQSGTIIKKLEFNPPLRYVKALLADQSGVLYIGHLNGLTRYDGANYQTYTQEDGLPDNRVNSLMQDRDGRLWVGTWGGAGILDRGKWHILRAADGLIDDMVNVMLQDSRGGIWFGSNMIPRGGISYLKDGVWQLFSIRNGLPHNYITSLFEDKSGDIWAGTGLLERGGAVRFVLTGIGAAILQVLTQRDGLAGEKVRSILQDKDGVMWFGSEYDGLSRLEEGRWRVLTMQDGLSSQEVTCMLQDIDGNLWLGTTDGLTRLNPTALKALHGLASSTGKY